MFVAELFIEFYEEPKPFAENILRCIEVAIMMMATFGADPLAYAEVLDSRVLEATISACLRGGVEPVHCKENASPSTRICIRAVA